MKNTYEKPQTHAVLLHGPALMLGGSNEVNNYNRGDDINVGDNDERTEVKARNYFDWDN